MTEVELLAQQSSAGDFLWSLLQYWTGVSMGVLIAAHLAASRLGWVIIAIFLVTYIAFSFQVAGLVRLNVEIIRGTILEFQSLSDQGIALGRPAQAFLEYSPLANQTWLGRTGSVVMGYGMFLITCVYPISVKLKAEK